MGVEGGGGVRGDREGGIGGRNKEGGRGRRGEEEEGDRH